MGALKMATVNLNKSFGTTRSGREAAVRQITQAELLRLPEMDAAAKGRETLRGDIIRRLEAGATIEPGELHAYLEILPVDRPTWDGIKKCLDPDAYARLRESYQKPCNRFLHIRTKSGDVLR
jgi:hypothetical protein